MEHADKNFLIALAYTAAHEKDCDLLTFREKVVENKEILSDVDKQQPLPKVKIGDRSKLGI